MYKLTRIHKISTPVSELISPSFTGAYSTGRTFGLPFGVSVITQTIRHTVGLLWTSDQTVGEAYTYIGQHNI
jgi:hypothetical protein